MKEDVIKEIAGQLSGKRIVLCGAENPARETFRQELLRAAKSAGGRCRLLDDVDDAKKGDYVILFTDTESDGSVPVPQRLLKELIRLCAVKPASALLVSGAGVYGRFFGDGKPRKETELGYVGHTRPEDIPLQRMRLAEHMACRLAREEGLPVKVVRLQSAKAGTAGEAAPESGPAARITEETGAARRELRADAKPEAAQQKFRADVKSGEPGQWKAPGAALLSLQFCAAIKVLLYGENGGIYNLPEQAAEESARQTASPLSPQRLWMDTGKVEKLSCCETI